MDFVLRENWRAARAGVRDLEKVQERSDVHLLGVVAGIGFGQIEDEICAAPGRAREQGLRAPVENVIRRLVAKLLQGFEDFFAIVLLRFLLALRLSLALARLRTSSGSSAGSSSHKS